MNISILGASSSKFGELWDVSPRTLVSGVVKKALEDAQVDLSDIDALYVGNMLSGILGNQENIGALFADELGVTCPAFKIEGACASGGLAVHNGVLGILSGQYKRVLVVGVEKMTDHKPEHVAGALMGAGGETERIAGLTFPGLYALMARAYFETYGADEKTLASVSVKNHFHGALNPNAHFHSEISVDQVLESPYITDPLKLLDCSPISDGASAVVLADSNTVSKQSDSIKIVGSAVATDTLALSDRASYTSLSSTKLAAKRAYHEANIQAKDIDIAEVHDCFTIAELFALEDLGFCDVGKSGEMVARGDFTLGSTKKLTVNTSGGLKACGHPVGATGVKQIVEVFEQLKEGSGKRQVENARVGLTHNVGGSGAVAVIHILKK